MEEEIAKAMPPPSETGDSMDVADANDAVAHDAVAVAHDVPQPEAETRGNGEGGADVRRGAAKGSKGKGRPKGRRGATRVYATRDSCSTGKILFAFCLLDCWFVCLFFCQQQEDSGKR